MSTLVEAIESGDTGTVWKLAREGADLAIVDEASGLTPLAIAAEAGQAEVVRILLEAGADPDEGGVTSPLEAAVVGGHLEVVEALIGKSVDVDRKVEEGFTPLMTAAATGNVELVQVLLDAGARPRLRNDAGQTALTIAEEEGHDDVVEALRAAARRRREEAEEQVRADEERAQADQVRGEAAAADEAEAEPEESTEPGIAPLDFLTMGADLAGDGMDDDGSPEGTGIDEIFDLEELVLGDVPSAPETADDESLETAGEALPVFAHLDADLPPAEPAEDRQTAEAPESPLLSVEEVTTTLEDSFGEALAELGRRMAAGEPDKVREQLETDAFTRPDEAGRTALMAAAHLGDAGLVKALIEAGADVNACDHTESGHTPLICAVNSLSPGRHEVISILVNAGADLDQRCGRNQRTALMHAAAADVYLDRERDKVFAQTTKSLIELGADLEVTDRRGRTVWHAIKRDALGAPTFADSRRRLHQMLRVLEYMGAQPVASHRV